MTDSKRVELKQPVYTMTETLSRIDWRLDLLGLELEKLIEKLERLVDIITEREQLGDSDE